VQTCSTSPQDSSGSDSDYSNGSCSDEENHDEERAARKVHLIPNEIPIPNLQDIVMDRAACNKMYQMSARTSG
jgi:hypothetical protein